MLKICMLYANKNKIIRMKISIPNFITSIFFLFVVPYLAWLCFVLLNSIVAENSIDIYKIVGLFFLGVFECLFLYILIFKFKIIKIDDAKIYSFYPFLNKRKYILWEDLHSIDAQVVPHYRLPSFRKITIKGKKEREKIVIISFTDREFENFNALTDNISVANIKKLRQKIDIKLARDEKNTFLLYSIGSVACFLFVLYKSFFGEVKSLVGILIFLLLLLFLSIQNIRKTLWIFGVLKKNNCNKTVIS